MDSIKAQFKRTKDYLKDQYSNTYRSWRIKYQGTKVYKNIDSLVRFQNIYYELLNNDLPLLKGGTRRSKARKAQTVKGVIMFTGIAFFCMYTRMGILNRIMVSLIACNSLIFFSKCYFYQKAVEEVAHEMNLTGQEARIQIRYNFPDHPEADLYKDMCERYKNLSLEQKQQQEKQQKEQGERKEKERRLDEEFENRLKSIDLEEEQEGPLPTKKKSK